MLCNLQSAATNGVIRRSSIADTAGRERCSGAAGLLHGHVQLGMAIVRYNASHPATCNLAKRVPI
ncbi:hypothetical protein BD414DRAFT_497286 [Trametes punicea]|nr:hypothetical protein BD414DRAFT_497286 [Trametes punicea]